MMRYYVKTSFRSIFRTQSNAWIHILGLTLGLSITMLIWMHVFFERNYDRFFDGHQNIFRVINNLDFISGEPMTLPTSMFSFGDMARDKVPEIIHMTRLSTFYFRNTSLKKDEKLIYTPVIGATDSSFFSVFSVNFLAGDPETALEEPNSIVLTYSLAETLFETPLLGFHKSIQLNDINYLITAIVEDLPKNSHIAFNGLVSYMDLPERARLPGFGFYTYMKLNPNADLQALEAKLSVIADQALQENQYFEMKTVEIDSRLINLTDIHLNSNLRREMKENGNLRNVRVFSAMSIFILLLAIINYTNMATARSSMRAKEIGLRKVAGSPRSALIRQFMVESFIITLFAFILSLVLAKTASPYFSESLGINIAPDMMFSPKGLLIITSLFIFTGIVSGIYPALYLSSFNPTKVLKGEMVKGVKGKFFRRSLVVFQFTITISLVSSLMIIAMQLNFLNKQPLGYQKDSILIARGLSRNLARAFPDIVDRLEAMDGIDKVSGTNFVFGDPTHVEVIHEYGLAPESGTTADILTVDDKFIPLLEIKISEGRNFHPTSEMDAHGAYLLNRSAVLAMGHRNPIGMQMEISGRLGNVVGIVEDFQLKSLHNPVEPVVFRYASSNFNQIYMKLNDGNQEKTREKIYALFKDFDPAWIPDLIFMDEKLKAQYSQELQSVNLLSAGSLLAIIVSLLGVYGLASFSAEGKYREIGIRKILGASNFSLLWSFNKEFFVLVIVSLLISTPITWWAIEIWLNNFKMRIQLNVILFLLPAFITFLFSSIIISQQAWKAAKENPVEAIKSGG